MRTSKKSYKKILSLVLAALMLLSIIVVPGESAQAAGKKYVTGISLSKNKATLNVGKSAKIKVTVKVKNKASRKFTAKSSKKAVATAKVSGNSVKITGKKAGNAVITISSKAKNKKGKVIKKKINVTVRKQSGNDETKNNEKKVTISATSASIAAGSVYKLNLKEGNDDITDQATWTTANADVATVSVSKRDDIRKIPAYANVFGQYNGSTIITAAYNGKTYSCTVKVTGAFDPKTDLTVEYSDTTIFVDFNLKKTGGAYNQDEIKELRDQGCTVNEDTGRVTKNQVCEVATYKFKKLPKTLGEIKALMANPEKDDTVDSKTTGQKNYGGFNAMAANICTACAFDGTPDPSDPYKEKSPVWDMFEYINGPAKSMDIAKVQKDTAATSMKAAWQSTGSNSYKSFFQGAKRTNNYTPSEPYTLVMYKGPYFIDKKQTITGTRPTTYMIFVPGDETTATGISQYAVDSYGQDRYIDVYYSTVDKRWYSYQNQFLHVTANGFRLLEEEL